MAKYKGTLSKDLPGGRVAVPAGSENKSYYKYYLEPVEDVSAELKQRILSGVFKKGEGLEIEDRARIQDVEAFPSAPGYYALKGGGAVSCANVKTPDLDAEMFAWWADWHGIDPLRYAVWDNEDHYGLEITKNKDRLTNPDIPVGERVWTTEHQVFESFIGDEPGFIRMEFFSPWECGYDKSLSGTDRWLYGICANAFIDNKIPVFATEILCKGADGVNEIRSRFWIGYSREADGTIKRKIPRFIKVPTDTVHKLVMHNFREFTHLNSVLPRVYAENKDNWTE